MNTKMRDVFESAVRRWVEACGVKTRREHADVIAEPDALLERLIRLSPYVASRLGMALHEGTLVTDTCGVRPRFRPTAVWRFPESAPRPMTTRGK